MYFKSLLSPRFLLCAAIMAGFTSAAFADGVDNLLSSQSFTGLMLTPNAQVIDHGDISLSYHQGVPYKNGIAQLDDWFFAAGVFPGLEAGSRIVTKTYNCNLFFDSGCGIRDLSASLKYQLPYVYDYSGFNVAVGIQDVGGAANNFSAKYLVVDRTFNDFPLRLSAGYGQSKLAQGILDGAFGGAEWQPLSFMQLAGEYDASELNATAKLFTPDGLLPWGAQLSMDYQLYSGHKNVDQRVWGVNMAVPLLGYQANKKRSLTGDAGTLRQQLDDQLVQRKSASLKSMMAALKGEGFLNLRLGQRDDTMVVALENRRYNHNQMDGVGVALGIIASYAGEGALTEFGSLSSLGAVKPKVELLVLTNGIPMMSVSTDIGCYREFLSSGSMCASLKMNTYAAQSHFAQTRWLQEVQNNGFGRSQIIISPAMYYNVATEYGVFDYSLALATNLYTPLWKGSAVDVRYLLPLSNSDDFKDGKIWADSAFKSQIDRALIHQAFKLPENILTQFSAGYVYGGYWGGLNETQWFSPQGQHSLGFEVSKFIYKDDVDDRGRKVSDRKTMLGQYTFSYPRFNWQLALQGGEFLRGDEGIKVTSSHWLGDVRLNASYLTSRAKNSDENEQFLALSIAIPLTPWRDMTPGYVQLRGIDQYGFSLQTRVGETHNNLNSGLGGAIDLQHKVSRQYQNSNRMTPAYFKANIQRLRNAYLRYVNEVLN